MRWTPHVTVAAVIEREDRFLLVKENIQGEIVYNQPAGHWEDNETLLEAVEREVLEETAWQFTPQHLTAIYQWKHPQQRTTFLRFTFCGELGAHDPTRDLDTEILETVWLDLAAIRKLGSQLRSPQVVRSIEDYLQGQRHSLDLLASV